ncbi:hypothetical protein [Oleibacter sp. HI0075]|mgnify:FL=1|jgi:hypothetical protein|uniref:hypothetical protein n=1 Tax=Thalassolituus sp. TaxID=2030822 RepID=UPI0007D02476|nr:hypothetical protein A3746_08155 [Oleibacter sp. HI0075]KZZ02339.1 hypothetical protein A3746_17405 [Oleibacter sp. HI0075]MEC7545690.1 hypothetical protein [Pseudomonadota bacterium]|tara:strand:+ start:1233 stop:1775 length:543 start_codon:yes stop_codon:yes gene_type:complete
MLATHDDAERRYESFREMARNAIQKELPYTDRNNIRLGSICPNALMHAKRWNEDPRRLVEWSWDGGYRDYSYRNPKRFELATWYGNTLAGLSLGRPSYAGTRLRLEFIESRPSSSPLKGRIVPITISVAELYASIIGAEELRIIDPIDDRLIEYYSSFGYIYRKATGEKNQKHYLVKAIS